MKPILSLLEKIWEQSPDMRLGQLIECMNIGWNTEDANEVIVRMCEFADMDVSPYLLWGSRTVDGLVYKPLASLELAHLENIIKDYEAGVQRLSPEIKEAIEATIKEKNTNA